MASTRISSNLPPNIDPSRATSAYGTGAIIRLNNELQDNDLITRQRSVKALSDYLHDHEHIAEAIRTGVLDSLKQLLSDPDVTCRGLATQCLQVMSQHSTGRDAFLRHGIIEPLAALFDDAEPVCRRDAHRAIEAVAETPFGAEGVVGAGLVAQLIQKAESELDEIREYILDTLHFCLRLNTDDALRANGMEVFTALLSHPRSSICAKAARDIMDLSVPLDGKNRAVDCETVPALIKLLEHNSTEVRANAAGALGFIAITTQGKYTTLNASAIPPTLKLVEDENSEVRVSALKLITCLAEAPEGRHILKDYVDKIRFREQDPIAAVGKHASIALKVITWKP